MALTVSQAEEGVRKAVADLAKLTDDIKRADAQMADAAQRGAEAERTGNLAMGEKAVIDAYDAARAQVLARAKYQKQVEVAAMVRAIRDNVKQASALRTSNPQKARELDAVVLVLSRSLSKFSTENIKVQLPPRAGPTELAGLSGGGVNGLGALGLFGALKNIGKSIGKAASSVGKFVASNGPVIGGVAGAVVGSIVPGVGTALGASIGGAVGGLAKAATTSINQAKPPTVQAAPPPPPPVMPTSIAVAMPPPQPQQQYAPPAQQGFPGVPQLPPGFGGNLVAGQQYDPTAQVAAQAYPPNNSMNTMLMVGSGVVLLGGVALAVSKKRAA